MSQEQKHLYVAHNLASLHVPILNRPKTDNEWYERAITEIARARFEGVSPFPIWASIVAAHERLAAKSASRVQQGTAGMRS